jgi:hypothetical protein
MKHIKGTIKATAKKTPTKSTSKFINSLHKATSVGRTENDAVTYTRSSSALLDFFAQAGAMRKNKAGALDLFKKAFSEDRQSAVRILFYLRDVRGGQGERDLFRAGLEWLGTDVPEVFDAIIEHVPEYGRWDDAFFDTPAADALIKKVFAEDVASDRPTLLAKWLPTMNASSPTTRAKASFMAKKLGLDDKTYRQRIRDIRKKIRVVESQMSAREWASIEYSAVPSQAARIYRNAFKSHDEKRYNEFIAKAEKGEEKINAATLYPYQIYKSAHQDYSPALNALWTQLPDYTQGKNALVVADVSGSMEGDPMSVSVSLALYFAERNAGQFQDYFITFSGEPKLQKVMGKTLLDKMNSIETADWEMNTNLQAVFNLILDTAVANKTPQDELPSTIYIVSDMEFDSACDTRTNFEVIEKKYAAAGYEKPTIVFWNVDARSGKNLPVQAGERNVAMVSGFSPVAFKMAVENKTPEQVMEDTINSERYARIVL